ncbi:hypothetical protein Srot_1180 [Segniliparus rotundus DSM 44985]|uniref:Uncharacterized protein n=1 Tax=Segniliparus rotundus (strain ATCC BAA-972 / CDC 1076 / CIP 108378 / DSM 44985 / JCM 13578) TaxID=640132 RepID=D6ZFC7_SEGRD|nr:hypothetical protein [Segniliparus rotundus]ADG97651.1 hypothetical protein Srot_1180 [Segniliparus rotundus DSM 44985]
MSPPRPGETIPLARDLATKHGMFAKGVTVEVLQLRYLVSLDPPGSPSPPKMTAVVAEDLLWAPDKRERNHARLERDRRSAELHRLRSGQAQTVRTPVAVLADLYLHASVEAQDRADNALGARAVDAVVALHDRREAPKRSA